MNTSTEKIQDIFKPYLNTKTVYKIRGAADTQQRFYNLSSNENPIGTSPLAIKAIEQHTKALHHYPDNSDARLCQVLADDFDHQILAEQFIASNSGCGIIDLILRAFIEPGDEIIVSTPCFFPYVTFSKWYGAKTVDIPLVGQQYEIDVEGILSTISSKTKIIFLNSPNNPTGTIIPKNTLASLLAAIPANVLVVYDEVYRHFADHPDFTNGLAYVEQYENVIAVNSFSKTYGLAGMRMGYCYSSTILAQYIRQLCRPFLIPKLSLEAAIAAVQDYEFIQETVRLVRSGRVFLSQAFERLDLAYTASQGNYIMIQSPFAEDEFTDFLYQKGILVRPVRTYGAPGKIRISIGNEEANVALVKALVEL